MRKVRIFLAITHGRPMLLDFIRTWYGGSAYL